MNAFFQLAVILSLFVLYAIAWCKIAERLGYGYSAGFLMIIPLVGQITLLIWAFNECPNERKIRRLQSAQRDPDPRIAELLSQIGRADPPPPAASDPL